MVTIEFEAGNVTANESDGSVTVNLVRIGNQSESITVYISIMGVENSAIAEGTYVCSVDCIVSSTDLMLNFCYVCTCSYVCVFC